MREQALEDRERGDWGAAQEKLRSFGVRARAANIDDAQLNEEVADVAGMHDLFAAGTVYEADEKYMKQRAYDMKRGRSSKSGMISRQRKPRSES